MVHVDYLIIGIVLASVLIGYMRGFFPEVLSIATWVVAVWGAWKFAYLVEPMLDGKLGSDVVELWAGRIIIGISLMLVGGLIGQLVALLIDRSGLTGTNRTLGLVFGLVRGAAVVGMLVIFAQMLGFPRDAWWQESALMPLGEQAAEVIRGVLPESVEQYLEPDAEPAPPPDSQAADNNAGG